MPDESSLKIAFCLFAYRPFGGLQRDFRRIAQICAGRGHAVDVFTMQWQGAIPEGFDVHVLPVRRLRNHERSREFSQLLARELRNGSFNVVVGFNRITGIDVYYAADPCYVAKIRKLHGPLYRLTGRYRHFSAVERELFGPGSETRILLLAEQEIANYVHYYHTPLERFTVLPPGISPDRRAPPDAARIRKDFRKAHKLGDNDRLVLMVGSGFRTKGLDRAIRSFAALPEELGQRSTLMVVGEDNERPFRKMAKQLGVAGRVRFMQGQDDVTRFMLGADLLIHPAYSENTGTVLLEAVIAGLPVLATDVCGYAFHVERAGAGRILASPFRQARLNGELVAMLDSAEREQWSRNGIRYGLEEDLYSMPEVVADYLERYAGALQ
jgi:UDP-glucose:(heptosyl)LPS alpha-1,3-glucosyltransferase